MTQEDFQPKTTDDIDEGIQMLQIRKIFLKIMKFDGFQQFYYQNKSIMNNHLCWLQDMWQALRNRPKTNAIFGFAMMSSKVGGVWVSQKMILDYRNS